MSNKFNVGDMVVYPAHGVGKITALEPQIIGGTEINFFVVTLYYTKENMTLRVPESRASAVNLRHLSTKAELKKILSVLQTKPRTSKGMWSKRAQEYETKINSGDPIAISEVVRDLYKNVEDPEMSYSERKIYEMALNRLVCEFAAIEEVTIQEATECIIDYLKEKIAA